MRFKKVTMCVAVVFCIMALTAGNSWSKEIKIGFQGVLSGVAAAIGDGARMGAEFMVEQVNKAGGINGKMVKLIVIDDKANPMEAVEAAKRLIEAEKVVAIVNGGTSTTFLASSQIAGRHKVPMVGHIQSDPAITQKSEYAFRICVTAAGLAYPIAEYAMKDMGFKNFAIMNRNDGYGNSLTEFFTKKVKEMGGSITTVQSYQPGNKDFKANLIKANATKPDAIFLTGFFADSGLITKQIREMGIKTQILGQNTMSDPGYLRISGSAAEGAVLSSNFVAGVFDNKGAENFEKAWKQKYGKVPGSYAAHGYDATGIIVEAIKTGAEEPEQIKNALFKITNYDGAAGYINRVTDSGDVEKPAVVLKIQGKTWIPLKTYIVSE